MVLSICFQQTLNGLPILSQSQIWTFNPSPPKFWNFLKTIKVSESSCKYASNEPSTTFQSCRKIKVCIFLCFGPQMPKYGNLVQAPKLFNFLKKIIEVSELHAFFYKQRFFSPSLGVAYFLSNYSLISAWWYPGNVCLKWYLSSVLTFCAIISSQMTII